MGMLEDKFKNPSQLTATTMSTSQHDLAATLGALSEVELSLLAAELRSKFPEAAAILCAPVASLHVQLRTDEDEYDAEVDPEESIGDAIRRELGILKFRKVSLTLGGQVLSLQDSFSDHGVEEGSVIGVHIQDWSSRQRRVLRNMSYLLNSDTKGCAFSTWLGERNKRIKQRRMIHKSIVRWYAVSGLDTDTNDKMGAFEMFRNNSAA